MKGLGVNALHIDPLCKGTGSVFGERDQQDFLRIYLVPVEDIFDLPNDGSGFTGSGTCDDEVVVFIGNDGCYLLDV